MDKKKPKTTRALLKECSDILDESDCDIEKAEEKLQQAKKANYENVQRRYGLPIMCCARTWNIMVVRLRKGSYFRNKRIAMPCNVKLSDIGAADLYDWPRGFMFEIIDCKRYKVYRYGSKAPINHDGNWLTESIEEQAKMNGEEQE